DEARSPSRVVVEVVGPLARLTDQHGRRPVRLIVGVRSARPQPPPYQQDHRPDPGSQSGLGLQSGPDPQSRFRRQPGPGSQPGLGPGSGRLLGSLPSLAWSPDFAPQDPGHGLLDLLRRAAGPAEVSSLRTDGPEVRQDIATYLVALLALPGSPYA